MAISTYAELKTAVADWMARGDLSGYPADFITLAEAKLNRQLGAVETDTTLTGTVDNRRIDISSLSIQQPIALFLVDTDEIEVTPKSDGTFPYLATSSRPRYWAIDGTNIDFDCPLDTAYSFRLRYRQKFALSDSATTNWLLTNHPDVYLAAALMWGGAFTKNFPYADAFSNVLTDGIPEVKNAIAQSKRGVLTVDPGLAALSFRHYYNGVET